MKIFGRTLNYRYHVVFLTSGGTGDVPLDLLKPIGQEGSLDGVRQWITESPSTPCKTGDPVIILNWKFLRLEFTKDSLQ